MWAAPPPASFTPNTTAAAAAADVNIKLPPQRCLLSFAVSAKSRPPENRGDKNVKVECRQSNVGVIGQAVITAFKSKAQQQQKQKPSSSSGVGVKASSTRNQGHQQEQRAEQESKKGGDEERRRQLSGSDVLWALQRASAEKAKKQQQKKKKRDNANRQEELRAAEVVEYNIGTNTTTSVGPWWLCIKSEWGVRLEELENRLEELMLKNV